MHKVEYPYLNDVARSGVPFSVISAGTDLEVSSSSIYSGFSDETVRLLREVNDKSKVFTTRGSLTQTLCMRIGLDRAEFSGDIAFFSDSSCSASFERARPIRRIVVSDPHRPKVYMPALSTLVRGLQDLFPDAGITIAQHGVGLAVEEFCKANSVGSAQIYKNPESGLDIYEDADMHVGFRVHAHVSALKRGKYSYLLEQDGRGCDYGLTLGRKVSVPNYSFGAPVRSVKSGLKMLFQGDFLRKPTASVAPALQLLSLISSDRENGFERFMGFDKEIKSYSEMAERAILRALS